MLPSVGVGSGESLGGLSGLCHLDGFIETFHHEVSPPNTFALGYLPILVSTMMPEDPDTVPPTIPTRAITLTAIPPPLPSPGGLAPVRGRRFGGIALLGKLSGRRHPLHRPGGLEPLDARDAAARDDQPAERRVHGAGRRGGGVRPNPRRGGRV